MKNVIVQYAEKISLGDGYVTMQLVGSGKAEIFVNGKVMQATWERSAMSGQTTFYDENGKEFTFAPGNTWIEVYPSNTTDKVTYQ